MLTFFIRRLTYLCGSLFLVATLTFFLMRLAPGDPFTEEKAIPEEIMKALNAHYGLDRPLGVQYLNYLKGIVTFDLGPSLRYEGVTIQDVIKNCFPVSLTLGLQALFLAIILGISSGAIAALCHQRWQDRLFGTFAVIGISIPGFLLATFLQYLFAMKWDLLPVARWGTFSQTILPTLSLAAIPSAYLCRLVRSSLLEVKAQEYILTAKAKGLGPVAIFFKHQLKNAIIPVVTYLGPLTASILTGSFVIEKIFGIPGLGGWFVMSIANRDYTLIMGTTMFYSVILMLCVLIVDLLYFKLDPRIRHE